ncbi:MAG: tRNA (adenosine(37)-N6)-dimethylallyltransferase MiaA [bacterium]
MHKLLCIVGPTGTGKTALALRLSARQPSILISADSRQVYRGMDIVTGKDQTPGIKLYGIDLVDPDESCSVAVWYDAIMPHIIQAWKENKQVIVVGGTGLYVKAITHGIKTMRISINQPLRDQLSLLSITEQQAKLNQLDPTKFSNMNQSDQNNPRRLIRAIEIAHTPHQSFAIHPQSSPTLVGLKYFDDSNYRSAIEARVKTRLTLGAIRETEHLITHASPQALSAIGYRSIVSFLESRCTKKEMIEQWVHDELSYAKRQLTWFNKQKVTWYDIDKEDYDYTKN